MPYSPDVNVDRARALLTDLVETCPDALQRLTYAAALSHLEDVHPPRPRAASPSDRDVEHDLLRSCLLAVVRLTEHPDPVERGRAVLALQELTTPLQGIWA
ncbi:hypothetical protein MO973_09625 [Paenibacillus sp. TRM 82003]|uniref:hypothetical protein n=1 Tax=Kineococcus sp. TRM81007 TaxID=2925831 RepID=UPI001F59ECBD|nr:hypothetical protein [Kineococcus sp. TRM81007]MCI2238106.1 hypothetical protein [Kineococcus sp. TRM81007]MCI3920491.1 hypothetical protein [Paenibacillus sp. TRM 82003]